MMQMVAFDTHGFVKRLTKAGMPEQQAEVLASEQARLIENELATKQDIEQLRLATKQDIEQLRAETKRDIEQLRLATKQDIAELRTELKRDIAEVKRDIRESEQRITIRLGGMMAVAITLVAALIKLL